MIRPDIQNQIMMREINAKNMGEKTQNAVFLTWINA
jgi:hypothetical protein